MAKPNNTVKIAHHKHPDVDGGLKEIVLYIIKELNNSEDTVKKDLFHTIKGSMTERLNKMGVINPAEYMLFMQELGVLRKHNYEASRSVVWQVVDVAFSEEYLDDDLWFARAQLNVVRHHEVVRDLRIANQELADLKEQIKSGTAKEQFEELLAMIKECEDLKSSLAESKEKVEELEELVTELRAELEKSNSIDYAELAKQTLENYRSSKTA